MNAPPVLLSLGNVITDTQSSGTSPKISQWISMYNPGVFQTAVSMLGLRASEIMGMPLNSEIWIFYCFLGFQNISPIFSKPDVMEAHLLSASPLNCGAQCGSQLLVLQGEPLQF